MKQLLTLLCIALLCSCNAVKKATTQTHTNTDSTGNKTSLLTLVKAKDSTGTTTTQATEKKAAESGYKKTTTTVKEYFGDEVDLGDPDTETKTISWGQPPKFTYPQRPVVRLDTTNIKTLDDSTFLINFFKSKNYVSRPVYKETTTTVEEGTAKAISEAVSATQNAGKISANDSEVKVNAEQSSKKTEGDKKEALKLSLSLLPWWLWLILFLAAIILFYNKIKR